MSARLRNRTTVWLLGISVPLLIVVALVVVLGPDDLVDLRPLLAILALLAAIAVAVGWYGLMLPAVRRIERAADVANAMVDGRVEGRIDDRVPDEIGALGASLDRLAAQREGDRRSRDQAEERLEYQTAHDPLTGLMQRQPFRRLVERALDQPDGRRVDVVLLDLDDFTLVNELWGQAVGDEVLVAISSRLRRLIGDHGELARWAGDEFVVLLRGLDDGALDVVVDDMRSVLDEPVNTTAGPQPVSASVVSATGHPGLRVDDVLHDIDVSLRELKDAHARARAVHPETAHLVELALNENRLEVWYQPIVRLTSATGTQIVGAEAFVRLRSDDNTLHVASDFLGEIMSSAYAREIDDRMAALVLRDFAEWKTRSLVPDDFSISLNLSPASLRDADLGRGLVESCRSFGVSPACIVLDVSEEAGELDQIIAAELRQSGFRLSVDDLGFKRSNFDRLFSVGAEFAKLHRRWLDDEIMLDALVTICQRKGLQVVAEGVETMEQLALLHEHGVRLCQGYLISRPLSVADFVALLGAGRPQAAPFA